MRLRPSRCAFGNCLSCFLRRLIVCLDSPVAAIISFIDKNSRADCFCISNSHLQLRFEITSSCTPGASPQVGHYITLRDLGQRPPMQKNQIVDIISMGWRVLSASPTAFAVVSLTLILLEGGEQLTIFEYAYNAHSAIKKAT